MYLKHFAQRLARRKYQLMVRRIGKINKSFPVTPTGIAAETGYYWGISAEGVPHHHVEELFTSLEGHAETVLKVLLDDPDWALTPHWPLRPDQRHALAWLHSGHQLRRPIERPPLVPDPFGATKSARKSAPPPRP
ncbi:DUF4238 domain-containing protein [Streptomyces longwoodensis]|uniref:DUF4238 domain-containing protein n=1 Tax=Streptomyces longwoodensis TaxID=68231 RepID=UPI0033DD951D